MTNRETLIKLEPNFDRENLPLLIFVNKGIETDTQALTLEIIADTCGSAIARAATFIVSLALSADICSYDPGVSLGPRLQRKVGVYFKIHYTSFPKKNTKLSAGNRPLYLSHL